MAALIASLLQKLSFHLSTLSKIVTIPVLLYQNLFLLRIPDWYAARLPAPDHHGTPITVLSPIANEWRVLIGTSAFLLASNLGVFQISGAMADRPIRTAGFLSMAFASVSVIYSVVLVVFFSNLKHGLPAAVEDGNAGQQTNSVAPPPAQNWTTILNNNENERCVWWNASILLALPAIWTLWSAIYFVVVFLLLLWYMRVEGSAPPANLVQIRSGGIISAAEYMPSAAATVVLVIGGVYLVLMICTLRSWIVIRDARV